MLEVLAEANTSAGAPARICSRRADDAGEVELDRVPGLAASKRADLLNASVSEAAANTVMSPSSVVGRRPVVVVAPSSSSPQAANTRAGTRRQGAAAEGASRIPPTDQPDGTDPLDYLPVRSRWLQPGQQQGRRWPSSSSSRVRRMRRSRVLSCLASSTQQMNSLRASGVMSFQASRAVRLATSAWRRSVEACAPPRRAPASRSHQQRSRAVLACRSAQGRVYRLRLGGPQDCGELDDEVSVETVVQGP